MAKKEKRRVALYLRVSTTNGQTTLNQKRELEKVAERSGWEVVREYQDEGISGAKSGDKRPAFNELLRDATRKEFDLVAAWSVDRLGRSLQDLVAFLGEIQGLGVDLYLHQQAVDTSTPAGKALFQMMGVFAEFERAMIRERVNAGLARAREQGRIGGRPRVPDIVEQRIHARLAEGTGIHKVARLESVGVSVVQRVKAEFVRSALPAS